MQTSLTIRAWSKCSVGFAALLLAACATPPAGTGAGVTWPNLIVHLHSTKGAYLVDPSTDQVVANLPTGAMANLGATTPDGRKVYVANEAPGGRNVFVFDLQQRKETARLETGNRPKHPAVSPDGKWAFINHWGLDGGKLRLTFIDTGSDKVARNIDLDVRGSLPATAPTSMHNAWSLDSRYLFTVNRVDDELLIVDTRDFSVTRKPMPSKPHYPVPSPDGKELWMVVEGKDAANPPLAIVFDLTRPGMPEVARIRQPLQGQQVVEGHHGNFSQDGRYFYMLNRGPGSGLSGTEVAVYDAKSRALLKSIQTGSTGIGHTYNSPDGRYAVVTNYGNNVVSIIDNRSLALVKDITVGKGRMGHVAFTPDGRYAYLSNAGDGNLHKLDMQTLTVVKEVKTGDAPGGAQVLNVWTNVFEELPRSLASK
jgi:YVTN family beta-propeller protein